MPKMNELPADFKLQIYNLEIELTRSDIEKRQARVKELLRDLFDIVDNMRIDLESIEWLVDLTNSLEHLELPN